MTKTYSFKSNNNNTRTFLNNSNITTDYSKILDDIITADVINKNSYLFKNTYDEDIISSLIDNDPIIISGSTLKANNEFIKAANFLANYKSNKKTYKIPFILGKMYTLANGTPIVFYDDEIQIGFDTYKYSDFTNLNFLNGLNTNTKNIIINIYTTGLSNIKINIL